jgi:hypothetical protein
MKKLFFNYILALLCFVTCSVNVRAQDIQAEAKLRAYTIRIGDQTKLYLSVHQPVAAHVNFPKLADTITGKVQMISADKPDTAFDKDNHKLITITQGYTITCFDAGTYTIPPFLFATPGGVLKTNELTLQVQTVKVDTTKAIYDIKQPMVVSYTFFDWLRDNWVWTILLLAGILLVFGLIYYLRNRPKKERVITPAKPKLPIHTIALTKLNELRDKKLWQQDEVKQYYSELTDVLREYLEKRYTVKTQEKTTDEILTALKYVDIADENKNNLRQMLILADLVKFAKERPLPVENEQSIDNAINFVLKTQQVTEPGLNTEGGSVDESV